MAAKSHLAARFTVVSSLLLAPALSGLALAEEAKTVIYVATPMRNGLSEATVLLPTTVAAAGDTLRQRSHALFDALRLAAPERYKGVELVIPEGFDLARRAELRCPHADTALCELVLAEVGLSLRTAGVERVGLVGGKAEVSLASLPVGAMVPVLPFWAVLPPSQASFGMVHLGGRYMEVGRFYTMLKSRSSQVTQAAREVLKTGPVAARLAVARSAAVLGVHDTRSLMPLLDHPASVVRLLGLEVLAKDRSGDFLKRCARLVDDDPDPSVKTAAVRILVAAGRGEYKVYLLLDDLRLPDEGRVLSALERLVATGDLRVAGALVPLLAHSSGQVREQAAAGLVALKAHDAMLLAIGRDDVDPALRSRLARSVVEQASGSRRDRAITALLGSAEAADRSFALERVAKKTLSKHAGAVIAALRDPVAEVRGAAVAAAAALKAEKAVPVLASMAGGRGDLARKADEAAEVILAALGLSRIETYASHKEVRVRAAALRALGRLGSSAGSRSRGILMARLGDAEPSIRKAAVQALSHMADRPVVDKLLPLAGDTDPEIRAAVLRAAVAAKHPRAGEQARKGLLDRSDTVKLAAVQGVHVLKYRDALPDLWKRLKYGKVEIRRAVLGAILALANDEERKQHMELLAEMLFDSDPAIKALAISSVAGFREPLVYANLGSLVRSKEQALQIKALQVLGQSRDPRAIEYVVAGLLVEDRAVKVVALEAIRTINSLKAEKPLQEFIVNEPDAELKRKATEILDSLGG